MTAQGRDNRGVFRTLSNIYDEGFCENVPLNSGLKNTPMIDIKPMFYV